VPLEEWRGFDEAALHRGCAAQVQFGARRRRRQTLLRVSSTAPSVAASGAGAASYSVVELIIDDMPFLVDTLSMTLAQLGLSVQLIIHPILRVVRDGAGVIKSLHAEIETGPGAENGVRESWQYWRIDRVGDAAECEQLRRRLLAALADVRRACSDWMRMRNTVLKLCADISRHPPPLAADVIAESRALLQYMEAHHFTFLGMRESRLAAGPAARCWYRFPAARSDCCAAACPALTTPSPLPISGAHCAPRACSSSPKPITARPCIGPATSTTSGSNATTRAAG
jgi:NAD-specific glutamate dehydrogenase